MAKWPFVLVVLLAPSALAPARADECDSEVRFTENRLRAEGGSDLMLEHRLDRAEMLCRQSPAVGLSELRDIQREADNRARSREPWQQQGFVPPPVGEPWTGAGPGRSPHD